MKLPNEFSFRTNVAATFWLVDVCHISLFHIIQCTAVKRNMYDLGVFLFILSRKMHKRT